MEQTSEWVSLGEAARLIGVHPATIRNWAEKGELPFRRTAGGHRRFHRTDLKRWLASHRLGQPTEAQLVVQSALGRTRLAIADRQPLDSLGWYNRLSAEARDTMRRLGLELMDILINHLTSTTPETGLQAAHEIGEAYGRLLKGQKLSLIQAVEGYLYFSSFLLEALVQLAEANAGRVVPGWADLQRQIHSFTHAVLLGMLASYE